MDLTPNEQRITGQPTKTLKSIVTDHIVEKAFQCIQKDEGCAVENCHYELIKEDRYEDAITFTAVHNFPDEPLCKSFGVTVNDEMREILKSVLQHNLSIALVSSSTKEIIGLRVIRIGAKEDEFNPDNMKSEGTRKLLEFHKYKTDLFDVYGHYGVDEAFEFFGLAIHQNYRRRGIGLKLMKAALQFIASMGVGPVLSKGDCDSNYSKCIYERLGFDCPKEIRFDDYNKFKGEELILNTDYASWLWDPSCIGLQEEVKKVQNRAARFVSGNNRFETGRMAGILKDLKWESQEKKERQQAHIDV